MNPAASTIAHRALCLVLALIFLASAAIAFAFHDFNEGQNTLAWLTHYAAFALLLFFWRTVFPFRPVRRALGQLGAWAGSLRRVPDAAWLVLAALFFFSLSYYLSGALYYHVPTETDSVAQYAGGRIFARGMWTVPSHALPAFFNTWFFINDGHFYTFYPPGHMMLLAIGHWVGNPALVNPLLGTASLIATYFLTREIAGMRAARMALLLFNLTPFIFFISAEFDNRVTSLLGLTLFALFFIKTIKTKRAVFAVLCGFALGYVCITRPQTALPYAIPFALYALWELRKNWRVHMPLFSIMGGIIMLFLGFFLYYNWQTNGDPLLTGYQKYWGAQVVPGSGITTLEFWMHQWTRQTARAIAYVQLLDRQFFCWPIGSLTGAIALWLCRAQKPFCGLLAGAFVAIVCSFTFTPYLSIIFGPRYLFETSSIVILFTALFLVRVPALLHRHTRARITRREWTGLWVVSVVVMTAFGLATTTRELAHEYGNNYRVGRPHFAHRVIATVKTPALVLIDPNNLLDSMAYYHPPFDDNPIIVAHDRAAENQALIDYYPQRYIYRVTDEHTITQVRAPVSSDK